MLEFLNRQFCTEQDFRRRYNQLRKATENVGVGEKSDALLDLLAHETVQQLLASRKRGLAWNLKHMDFETDE
jgi:hypothetical protein